MHVIKVVMNDEDIQEDKFREISVMELVDAANIDALGLLAKALNVFDNMKDL